MNALKKPLVFVSTLIVVTLLLSWTLFDDFGAASTSSSALLDREKLKDGEITGFLTNDENSPRSSQPPAAEDVLIQRIPGDNSHLLLMAFYSKENYSGKSITIENGFPITLRDDGNGNDKIAGDGLYTAKIPADVGGFRNQAMNLLQKMRSGTYKPIQYFNRQRIVDPNAAEGFEITRFDANEPVSVSGITNALSTDFKPVEASAQTPNSARSTANGAVNTSASLTGLATLTSSSTTLDSIRQNSVFITNLAVVEDPARTWNSCAQTGTVNGPWTFGTLMRQLASKSPTQIATDAQVSDFVKNWLNSWANSQSVNGDAIASRTLVSSTILNPWLTKSQNAGSPSGQLNMKFAPFKLTAITNRFDLRNGTAFGVTGSPCGEGRFVFCLISSNCSGPLQMTVIFEYRINKPNTCQDLHAWAQQWVDLKKLNFGSSQYNQALQNITNQFTLSGTNTAKINQSSLAQVRTNEVVLSPSPQTWELREFTLVNVTTGHGKHQVTTANLRETTVKQVPADKFDVQVVNSDVQRMADFVNQNQSAVNAGTFTVPLSWEGFTFLGGTTHVKGNPTGTPPNVFHWDGTSSANAATFLIDNNARFNFSVQTCSGCHSGETQTAFTQVNPVFFGTEARLSGFLTGVKGTGGAIDFDHDSANLLMSVQDAALRPASNPTIRTFNDIDRRARDLQSFVSTTCGTVLAISSQLLFQPTTMVH